MRSYRVTGLVAVLVFGAAVFYAPTAVQGTLGTLDAEDCQGRELSVIEYARSPDEIERSDEETGTYENLTAAQQQLFDRGQEALGESVSLQSAQFETARSLPERVVRSDSVYRVRIELARCPLVAGFPPAANPIVGFLLEINRLVTGPLAPIIVVVGGVSLAFWAGRQLEY